MNDTSALDPFQSGFKLVSKTALVALVDDRLKFDSGQSSLLILLDLSASFDTVDHSVLIHQTEYGVGIQDIAFPGSHSFLSVKEYPLEVQNQLGKTYLEECHRVLFSHSCSLLYVNVRLLN